ncbi:MAG: AMP-binding protein [Eubacteriales bacterium]|nr:AMP-binding protein [Eubacteriales bacterium]
MNFPKSVVLAIQSKHISRSQILNLQADRLDKLVTYARTKSPYFKELYRNVGEHPDLTALPVTKKRELMANFDSWVTDQSINLNGIDVFIGDQKNIGKIMAGRCRVSLTSGSTGIPCKVLNDKDSIALSMSLYFIRTLRLRELIRLGLRWGKILIISNPSFNMIYNAMMAQVHLSKLNKYRCAAISIDTPPEEIIEKINAFKPAILYTYPSVMKILLPLIQAGSIKHPPYLLILGGERCSPILHSTLQAHLNTHILNSYGCSECSLIAYSCSEGHLHVYADWVIVEPVDLENRPVPSGVLSDKILVTNLSNYTQPFIRYEVDDRIIYHEETCACGNSLPFIEVEGRIDDNLVLQSKSGPVTFSPMTLASPSEMNGVIKYQVIHTQQNHLVIKLVVDDGYDRQEIFQNIADELRRAFLTRGVEDISFSLSDEIPQRHPVSGKFKMIVHQVSLDSF